MSLKFDSMLKILNWLDQGTTCTAQSMAGDLEVTKRTAYRYISALKDAGFRIVFEKRRGSYVFYDGYRLKKSQLNPEEELALSLAGMATPGLGQDYQKALEDLREKVALASKRSRARFAKVFVSRGSAKDLFPLIADLNRAISDHQKVRLRYHGLESGKRTKRIVKPYQLFFSDGWYLRGWCELRKERRTFALDRILDLKLLDWHFLPSDDEFDPDEVTQNFLSYIDGEDTEVVLRFDPRIKQHIQRKTWHLSQKTVELPGGGLEVSFTVRGTEGIKPWIYRWIPFVEIVEPEALRKEVAEDLKQQLARCGG